MQAEVPDSPRRAQNTLFNTDIVENLRPKDLKATQTVSIVPTTFELEEDGVKVLLTFIDTPGFGDNLNREDK